MPKDDDYDENAGDSGFHDAVFDDPDTDEDEDDLDEDEEKDDDEDEDE
jgi:hypothetical protein